MSNHSDLISPIDHDTLDDVTGACGPACTAAKPAAVPPAPKPGCGPALGHISANDRNGWPYSFQQPGAQPQFDFRGWLSSFMRRFR